MAGRTGEREIALVARHRQTIPAGRVSLLAFDFDGVISDSMPAQEVAWRRAGRSVGVDSATEDRLVTNLFAGCAGQRMFEGIPLTTDQQSALRIAKDAIWVGIRDTTPLMRGASEGLRALSRLLPLAIVTTADRSYVETLLSRDGLLSCFGHIITDKDVARPKPAPDMLVSLMTLHELPAQAMCVIGDSVSDFEMSTAAGCAFVRFASHEGWDGRAVPSVTSWPQLTSMFS